MSPTPTHGKICYLELPAASVGGIAQGLQSSG